MSPGSLHGPPAGPRLGAVEAALGSDFAALHPRLRSLYGATSGWHGSGVFEVVGSSHALVRLALRPLVVDRALPGGYGRDVPFTVNVAQQWDGERVLMRTERGYSLGGRRQVSVSVTVADRGSRVGSAGGVVGSGGGEWPLTDYLGDAPRLVTSAAASVEDGALLLRSSRSRVQVGGRSIAVPRPLGPVANTRHSFDEETLRHRIEVSVRHPWLGELLAYRGWFSAVSA